MQDTRHNDLVLSTYKPIGLTGGMDSGKTTVCDMLRKHNFEVINSDTVVHSLYNRKHPRYSRIAADLDDWLGTKFSDKFSIDRTELRNHMRHKPENLEILSRIILPYYLEEIERLTKESKNKERLVIEVPLLFESALENKFSQIVTVYADEDTQIARIKKRNPKLSEADIKTFLSAQLSMDLKESGSHHIVHNSLAVYPELLEKKVADLAKDLSQGLLKTQSYDQYAPPTKRFLV